MKTILKNNDEAKKYLDSLTPIYIVGRWASWGIREYRFSGQWKEYRDFTGNIRYVPLVWDYDDHNGTVDQWELRSIEATTTGLIYDWTFCKGVAEYIADKKNADNAASNK